jgi:hypothetical protein
VTASRLVSNIVTGTAPFQVSSTTAVPNLSIEGNAATATNAVNFSGTLIGDVTGTQGATIVSSVGTISATGANSIFSGVTAANNATSSNTGSRIVLRDNNGNFTAGNITATNFFGNATTATTSTSTTTATNATNTSITDDNATAAVHYPTFVQVASGDRPQKTSSSKLTFSPSTGLLTATGLSASQITSTIADGTAPFIVTSTTVVPNLQSATAQALRTPRSIYGANFDGTAALAGPVVGQFGGTGIDNTGKTITIGGGNLSTSGVGTLNLNTSAATNVTLPLSGTLYGTASATIASSALLTSLSDETGTGLAVFGTAPFLIAPVTSSLLADIAYLATKNATVGTGVQVASAVSGTNLAGTVTIVITGGAAASEALLTVNYSSNFPTTSYPVLYPATATASALTGTTQVFATGANNGFTINSGTAGLPNGTYTWNYQVIGR